MNMKLLAEVLDIKAPITVTKVMLCDKNKNEICIELTTEATVKQRCKIICKLINKYELEHDYKQYFFEKFNIKVGSYIRDAWISFPERYNQTVYHFETIFEACEFAYEEITNVK